MTIQSFGDDRTEKIFLRLPGKDLSRFSVHLLASSRRKLDMIEAAADVFDLASPPANRLERLSGTRKEFWSIRVNDQWRIIFRWLDDGAHDVQIVDYH